MPPLTIRNSTRPSASTATTTSPPSLRCRRSRHGATRSERTSRSPIRDLRTTQQHLPYQRCRRCRSTTTDCGRRHQTSWSQLTGPKHSRRHGQSPAATRRSLHGGGPLLLIAEPMTAHQDQGRVKGCIRISVVNDSYTTLIVPAGSSVSLHPAIVYLDRDQRFDRLEKTPLNDEDRVMLRRGRRGVGRGRLG